MIDIEEKKAKTVNNEQSGGRPLPSEWALWVFVREILQWHSMLVAGGVMVQGSRLNASDCMTLAVFASLE